MKEIGANLIGNGIKVGIVISRFNDLLTKQLLGGAVDCLVRHGVTDGDITVVWVPGANEAPYAAQRMAQSGAYQAIVVLGCVIQGATRHAEMINSQVSRSLIKVGMDTNVPVINGVITAENLEQAVERAGTKAGNKGWTAAQAAIEMVNLFKQI
ncbi:MAG: 6,7-dimethyl-8-ribityllumazine synthase [Kiritimatiellia bacterium]